MLEFEVFVLRINPSVVLLTVNKTIKLILCIYIDGAKRSETGGLSVCGVLRPAKGIQ